MLSCARVLAVVALVAAGSAAASAQAPGNQTPAEFYRGKTITISVAVGTGAYDLYARQLARHLPRFIPGNPQMIVNNMPGGGGVIAANHAANVAPRDGTSLLMPLKLIAMTQLLTPGPVKYDAARFQWIGSMVDAPGVLVVSRGSPARTLDEARSTVVMLGSTGSGGETSIFPAVINSVLGTRFKVITGFPGMADIFLGMERGELHGASTVYGSVTGLRPQWIKDRKVTFLANIDAARSPSMPDVPSILEFARTPQERQILEFLTLSNSVGRSVTAPPGVPADRVAALRAAFEQAVGAPEYLRETVEKGIDVKPIKGEVVQRDVERLAGMPRETVDLVLAALRTVAK